MASGVEQQRRIGRPPTCSCGECKKCRWAAYMRSWYATRTKEQRQRATQRRDPASVARSEANRKRPPDERERDRVRMRTRRAVVSGKLAKGNCERCASPLTQAHHEDYTRPLDVMWLCPYHHAERHRERVAEAAAQGVL